MEHLNRIYASFDYYRRWQFDRIRRKEGHYEMLPAAMKNLIPNFTEKFKSMRECVSENQKFLSLMTRHPLSYAQVRATGRKDIPSNFNMDKVCSFVNLMYEKQRRGPDHRRLHDILHQRGHLLTGEPSWTPKTQPNDSRAAVWLSFWCSTRPSADGGK